MKLFAAAVSFALLAATPALAQATAPVDKLALACHVALRYLNLQPADATHAREALRVTITFKSGAEGGAPNGIQCDFANADADIPKLAHLITDTKRGYEAELNTASAQDAIDQYFTELKTFGSVMGEVAVSPLAAPAPAAPAVDAASTAEDDGEEISPEADKLFWCTHALAQSAAIAKSYGGEQAVIEEYLAGSQKLASQAKQKLQDEGFDTTDLSELNADYEADAKAQLVDRTAEAQYAISDCRVLAQN